MIDKVRRLVAESGMIEAGDTVVAGVSGGADSVCMLSILARLQEELSFALLAVHVHHGLRGAEADEDEAFVRRLCGQMKVTLRVYHYQVKEEAKRRGLTEEEAGRLLRYASFREAGREQEALGRGGREQEASGPGGREQGALGQGGRVRLAVAHHMDDSAETILMNLFRGSGLAGLGGIRPIRDDVIRPLIGCTRREIEAYLKDMGLSYQTDKTNLELDHTRNRIRNVVLPYVEQEVNAGAVKNILRAGHMISQAEEYLVEETETFFRTWGSVCGGRWCIGIEKLREKPEIFRSYVARYMLSCAAGRQKDLTAVHVEQILGLLDKESGRTVSLPYGLTAGREHEILFVGSQSGPDFAGMDPNLLHSTTFPYTKDAEIPKNMYTKWFDYDKIKGTLSARTRQPGDFITLAGGGRKTVKSFMIDEKIPRSLRDRILLVADGSHILWIVGYRISEFYKVTEHTSTILQIEYDGGNGHGRQDQSVVD